jgi:hypothetical protein
MFTPCLPLPRPTDFGHTHLLSNVTKEEPPLLDRTFEHWMNANTLEEDQSPCGKIVSNTLKCTIVSIKKLLVEFVARLGSRRA